MEGLINNYRRSRRVQNTKHIILSIPGVDKREKAQKFVGKKVVYTTSSGKEIAGEVASAHGNKGCIRAIFERGLPGQAIGTKVQVK